MLEILSASIDKVVNIIEALGYPGVFLLSFLDRLTVFLVPGEVILPAFGILVNRGVFDFWPVFWWVTVGAFLGNFALYFIFLKGGRPFLEKYGRYLLISKHDLNHLDRWFSKHGDMIVIFGYLLPTSIRSLIPIPAGISKMNPLRFSLYTLIASVPGNVFWIYIGMKTGDSYKKVLAYFDRFNYAVIAIIILFIVWYVIRHIKGRHLTHE